MFSIEILAHNEPATAVEIWTAVGTIAGALLSGAAVIVALATARSGRNAAFKIAQEDRRAAFKIASDERESARELARKERNARDADLSREQAAQARLVRADNMGQREPNRDGEHPEEGDFVIIQRLINHSSTPIMDMFSEVWINEDLSTQPLHTQTLAILLPGEEQIFNHYITVEGYQMGVGYVRAFRLRWTDHHGRSWCVDRTHSNARPYGNGPPRLPHD